VADTTNFIYSGDESKGRGLVGLASQGIEVLKNLMTYNNLKTYSIEKSLADGSHIILSSCYGAVTANIFVPPVVVEEKPKSSETPVSPQPVCVYVGTMDANHFCEYSVDDLAKKSLHYWGVLPEMTLDLAEKKLLILPCPMRVLTAGELSIIKKFMVGDRRVVLFAGSDTTSANLILRQLGSKLELSVPYTSTGLFNISGYITPQQLVVWPAYRTGNIGVHSSHSGEAITRDWRGYGLLYPNITTLSPYTITVWTDGNYPEKQAEFGSYMYSVQSYAFFDTHEHDVWATWAHLNLAPLNVAPGVPYLYTTENDFGTPAIPGLLGWMSSISASMPLYRMRPHGFVRSKTNFATGQYVNYNDILHREFTGAIVACAQGEHLIVAAYKPVWLTEWYSAQTLDTWYMGSLSKIANWMLNGNLSYVDLFNTGGFQALPPAYIGFQSSGGDGGYYQY